MPYTDAELLDMVTPVRQDRIRFDLLDKSLDKIGEVDVRADSVPTVAVDTSRSIIRTMSGLKLDADSEQNVDTFSARIRPVYVLGNGSEYPLGVFLFADASRVRFSYGLELDGTLVDQTLIVDQGWPDGTTFQAGTVLSEAMRLLSLRAGIPSLSIEPTALVLSAPISWPIGTTTLRAMRDLCVLAGYLPPYFDRGGTLVFRTAPFFFPATPTVVYGPGGRIIAESMVESDDLLSAPNRYVAIENGPGSTPISGIFDIPASAPQSYANRGFYVTKIVEAQGLTDTAAAVNAARAEYESDSDTLRSVVFQSTPDPRHDVFDIVEYLGVKYWELGWKLPLSIGGPMEHSLRGTDG
jgi:hypothetical protein